MTSPATMTGETSNRQRFNTSKSRVSGVGTSDGECGDEREVIGIFAKYLPSSQYRWVTFDHGIAPPISRDPPGLSSILRDIKTRLYDPPELVEALRDLHKLRRVAEEDGDVLPEKEALDRAESLLRAMFQVPSQSYDVYPLPDGDIAIDADTPRGTKVVIVSDHDGSARCLTYIDGQSDSREYGDPSVIPDSFIKEALTRASEQVLPSTSL